MEKAFVTGCYDIVHVGHIELFKYCKSIADWLVVGVDTDDRVKKAKGPERPINNLDARIEFLKAIRYVDEIFVFGSDEELIQNLIDHDPDYRVLGSDYKGSEKIVGEEVTNNMVFFDRVGDYSTTNIIRKTNSS